MALLLFCALLPARSAEPVVLATLDWPPYIGEKLPQKGFVHALVAAALDREGRGLDARFLPWARAVETARKGEVAGLFPEYYDTSRLDEFAFSDPIPGGAMGFYRRHDMALTLPPDIVTAPAQALRQLKQYRFGVVRGYLNTPAFDAADYLDKEAATSDLINLRKLAYGRVDLIIIDDLVARYLLRTELPGLRDQLVMAEPPLAVKPLYIAFSRAHPNWQADRQAFNRGLQALRESGELNRILTAAGINPR